MSYPVKVFNIPSQVRLRSDLPSEMEVTVEGSGIDLFGEWISLNRDTIFINFQKHAQNEYFYAASHLPTLNTALPGGLKALTAQPDTLRLKYEDKSHKIVPVVSRADIQYENSYRPVKPMEIVPDSVLVIGPEEELKQIRFWPTTDFATEETNFSIALDTIYPFDVFPKFVRITVEPEPFTEATQYVQVEIRGNDPDVDLKIVPEKVEIKYLVPMNRYEEVNPSSFTLMADLDKLNLKSPFLLPQLEKQPDFVTISGMEPPYLTYKVQKIK